MRSFRVQFSSVSSFQTDTHHECTPIYYSIATWVNGNNSDKVSLSRTQHIDKAEG